MPRLTTDNFDQANAQGTKEPVLVVQIEGIDTLFSTSTVYTQIKYDDPGVLYDGTYQYDGLRPLGPGDPQNPKRYIDRKGTKSVMVQKLEQWDGRSSVETLNMRVIDVNGEITNLITPGAQIEDILNRKVKVYFGYSNISYPQDFIRLFTGYVNDYEAGPGYVQFNFAGPSQKQKQVLFNNSTSKLTLAMDNVTTTVNVTSTSNFYQTITNAVGQVDPAVVVGFRIDDEFFTYTNADIISDTQLTGVNRAQFGSVAANHDVNADVTPVIRLSENCITMALKLLLSGWNGPWISDLPLRSVVNTDGGDPLTIPNSITFAQTVDVVRDYGLVAGDFVIISNSPYPGNNGTWTVAAFFNDNRTIQFVETGMTQENPPGGGYLATTAAFRSKYDTYPITAGLSLTPDEVNIAKHEYYRNVFLPYNMTHIVEGEESSGKQFIEENILKPLGGYSLSQGAKISMGVTHPPLASETLPVLDHTNIANAKQVVVKRGINTRFFYNEVLFNYNWDPIKKDFQSSVRYIDADAQSRLRQVSVLQLDCKGWGIGDEGTMQKRAARILRRYRYSSETIENITTFFGTGNTIDAGDVVILNDKIDPLTGKPILQITNTETGDRGVFNRPCEVQERNIDISTGQAKLRLLSNLGFSASDRYATVAPASEIDTVYSTSKIRLKDSFGAIFPGAEWQKWKDFQGSLIRVHNKSFTQDAEAVFVLDVDPYNMLLTPPLPFTPVAGTHFVQFAKYNQTSALINQRVKQTFVHLDPTATIFSGSTPTVFTLNPGFASRYVSGMYVYVMSPDGTRYSIDVKILTVVGNIVTVDKSLGFTPVAGDLMQLGGFLDGGAGYRYL